MGNLKHKWRSKICYKFNKDVKSNKNIQFSLLILLFKCNFVNLLINRSKHCSTHVHDCSSKISSLDLHSYTNPFNLSETSVYNSYKPFFRQTQCFSCTFTSLSAAKADKVVWNILRITYLQKMKSLCSSPKTRCLMESVQMQVILRESFFYKILQISGRNCMTAFRRIKFSKISLD